MIFFLADAGVEAKECINVYLGRIILWVLISKAIRLFSV